MQAQVPDISGSAIYPAPLTADSQPMYDEWGWWDDWWSPEAYIQWHKLNKQKYGKAVADGKISEAFDNWSSMGGAELDYIYNNTFRDYFSAQGIEPPSGFLSWVFVPLDDVTDVVSTSTGFLRKATPWLLFAGAVIVTDKYIYPIFPRKNGNTK